MDKRYWWYCEIYGEIYNNYWRGFSTTFKAIKSRAGFCGFKNSVIDFGRTCGLVFKSLILDGEK